MTKPMMKCGHTANATSEDKPCCVICAPKKEAFQISLDPDLTGRMMKCSYTRGRNGETHKPVPSKLTAAFFEYRPDREFDEYYCGCWGWD